MLPKSIPLLVSLAAILCLATESSTQMREVGQYAPNFAYGSSCVRYCRSRLSGPIGTNCCQTVPYTVPVRNQRHFCGATLCNPVQVPRAPRTCGVRGCGIRSRCNPYASLTVVLKRLVTRSNAYGYSFKTFIDELQSVIDNQWKYSWFGRCTEIGGSVGDWNRPDDVDIFVDEPGTTTDVCNPCSTTSLGVRRCSTRFQTILGSCDNCCHSSHTSRVYRSVGVQQPDLLNTVSSLLERAPRMTRHSFLAELKVIVANALAGLYSWDTKLHPVAARRPTVFVAEDESDATVLEYTYEDSAEPVLD